ncbi:hypothetical protein Tco_0691443 [Tanacetum coccineum]
MGALAKHPHSDSNEVYLVTRKYRYTNKGVQFQIDLFKAFALTLKKNNFKGIFFLILGFNSDLKASLDPLWSDLELHVVGELLRQLGISMEELECNLLQGVNVVVEGEVRFARSNEEGVLLGTKY